MATEPAQNGSQSRGGERDSEHSGDLAEAGGGGGSAARMAADSEAPDTRERDGEGERRGREEGACSDQELDDLLDCELNCASISARGATPTYICN